MEMMTNWNFKSVHGLGYLCFAKHPAACKSAGQTLLITIASHGDLLHQNTWQAVVWQVKQIKSLL
jgi:hypothetical protein